MQCISTNGTIWLKKSVAKILLVIVFIRPPETSLEITQSIPMTEKSIRFLRDIPQAEDDM
jgi:hypothetical protein